MTWFRCGGGGSGIPAALKNRMNAVLNKKFGTAVDYPPNGWPDDVNLLGELEEKTTAAASICSFSDGADTVPLKSWEVTLPASLSGYSEVHGTKSGDSVFFPKDIVQGSISGSGYNSESNYRIRTYAPTAVLPNTEYHIKVNSEVQIYEVHEYQTATGSSTYTTINSSETTITTRATTNYIRILFRYSNNALITPSAITYLQCTTGTLTPYTTYTASLGRTIYGGTADIVNGVGTDNGKKIKLNTLSWVYRENEYAYGYFDAQYNITDMTENMNFDCTNYVNRQNARNALADEEIGVYNKGSSIRRLVIRDDSCTTIEQFLTKIADYNLVYESTTGTDFTFTPITPTPETALGVNNFWSDEGDTEVTYRASGIMTPITPTLITKTITVNGSYQAADDQADGYSEVVVNVSGGSCERLLYLRCVNNDQIEIPAASSITQGAKYSQYVSYDSTTKKFTVLQDFTAIIIAWVYTYQTYESSRSDGALYINNSQVIQYEANGTAAGSTGGVYLARNFKQNDTFNVYTPTRDGYPQQNLKIYLLADVPDNIYTFTDENA